MLSRHRFQELGESGSIRFSGANGIFGFVPVVHKSSVSLQDDWFGELERKRNKQFCNEFKMKITYHITKRISHSLQRVPRVQSLFQLVQKLLVNGQNGGYHEEDLVYYRRVHNASIFGQFERDQVFL